jgi:hypothetical protein
MKRIMIIAAVVLGIISCKEKEEVTPSIDVPVVVKTNHVLITINSYAIGDEIEVTSRNSGAMVVLSSMNDKPYYLCNLVNNLFGIIALDNCSDNDIELSGVADIDVRYTGDVTVEYLESTL